MGSRKTLFPYPECLMEADKVTLDRLEEQISWCDQKSQQTQFRYKACKFVVLVASAIIPLVSLAGNAGFEYFTASLGVIIIISEGLVHLNQYHHHWIAYRSTCESLKHEKFLYLAGAGPYSNVENLDKLLAERMESLISQEHTKWVSVQRNLLFNEKDNKQ